MTYGINDQEATEALREALAEMPGVSDAAVVERLRQYLPSEAPDPQYGPPLEVLAVGMASPIPVGGKLKTVARRYNRAVRLTMQSPLAFAQRRSDAGSIVSLALRGSVIVLKGHMLSPPGSPD